ncbi:hypothetical protein [Pseudarthrobacter sp. fls2-241-R2A-127]|uniref:hypothetical protein n=1 Tax=Pseudarthrobacter sp. fls2-241-R2A-127 TaxID=3040303 RepID=UPI0025529F86|nr:hypothetical protein [Pseudarthrobacter sp. fls2-241-R2A-127]
MSSETGSNVPARPKVDNPPQDPAVLDPEAQDPDEDAKLKLQLAIFDVTRRGATGKSLEEIREMLMAAFAARNVAPPPFTWVESAASSAFYGEPYIIDYPTAIAADDLEAAPDEAVRERLADRRKLREVQLPEGILPKPSEWNIPANEVTSADPGRGGRGALRNLMTPEGPSRQILAATALAGVVLAALAVIQLSRRTSRASLEG